MRQSQSEALDEAARFVAPIFSAWGWDWGFGAQRRVPDVLDLRRKLDELANECLKYLAGDDTQKMAAAVYDDHLMVTAVRRATEDTKFDVVIIMGDGWIEDDDD